MVVHNLEFCCIHIGIDWMCIARVRVIWELLGNLTLAAKALNGFRGKALVKVFTFIGIRENYNWNTGRCI